MVAPKLIRCQEYEWLSYEVFDEGVPRRLERVQQRLGVPVFSFGRTHLQARQYVGAVRAGNTTVQILPKIHDREEHNLGFLLFMLRYTRRLRFRQAGLTDHEKLRGSFLEIWIRHFASELNRLLRTQPKHRYVEVEERTGFLRGKLLTERELAGTAVITARHACRYEIFTADHLLNQILKFCNNVLLGQAQTSPTRTLLEENAARLTEVTDRRVRTEDLARVHLNRLDKEYAPLLTLCRLLIEGYAPSMEAGDVEQLAFVFDMNVLFEEFVAEFLRRHKDDIVLKDGRSLKKVERQRVLGKLFGKFRMMVDLVLEATPIEDGRGERFLVDTKYKVLDVTKDHSGLSQTDFYQMYAYARAGSDKYRAIILLYPATEPEVEDTFYHEGMTLRVRQFDLRKIYEPENGTFNVGETAEEFGRVLSRTPGTADPA